MNRFMVTKLALQVFQLELKRAGSAHAQYESGICKQSQGCCICALRKLSFHNSGQKLLTTMQVIRAVQQYSGDVMKFAGDAMIIAFYPITSEVHLPDRGYAMAVQRCARCALQVRPSAMWGRTAINRSDTKAGTQGDARACTLAQANAMLPLECSCVRLTFLFVRIMHVPYAALHCNAQDTSGVWHVVGIECQLHRFMVLHMQLSTTLGHMEMKPTGEVSPCAQPQLSSIASMHQPIKSRGEDDRNISQVAEEQREMSAGAVDPHMGSISCMHGQVKRRPIAEASRASDCAIPELHTSVRIHRARQMWLTISDRVAILPHHCCPLALSTSFQCVELPRHAKHKLQVCDKCQSRCDLRPDCLCLLTVYAWCAVLTLPWTH